MQVLIQEKFENGLESLAGPNSKAAGRSGVSLQATVLIGDLSFLQEKIPLQTGTLFPVLISKLDELSGEEILAVSRLKPYQIIPESQLDRLTVALESLRAKAERRSKIQQIKVEIQKKRKELESLNEKLNQESEKQILSLEQSHVEESQKNIKEKSLLHFLDFIQSDSTSDDFLNRLIRFLWKDLKKLGRFYQIGVSFKIYSDKSNVYTYDGLNEQRATLPVEFKNQSAVLASHLASVWGRPVGRILSWPLPEFSKPGYFFVEVIDQQISLQQIDHYIKERLVVLSLYLDRWMIEREYEVLVDRWKRTFNSFSGYVHVIDEDYNIFQSNYLGSKAVSVSQKCYELLAQRAAPCPDCPLKNPKNEDFLLRPGLRVKTYSSEFKYNRRKYFFVIYEDVTQLHLLKGQMIHSEKMSALGRLGNHLAHELNNPLTGIKSYVQSLMDDPRVNFSTTIKSDLNEILKATVRSQNIIKNFINFSQRSESTLEKVVFLDVLQNALTLLKSVLRPHRLFVDMKSTVVNANAHDLQQVLFNLIKNSCQAMPSAGSIKIYEEEKDRQVLFHIEDSGPGFADEILQNIFEPFMTTKKKGEGTGLGLYLSKKMMKNMNADLQIQTLLHQGQKAGAKMTLIFDKL